VANLIRDFYFLEKKGEGSRENVPFLEGKDMTTYASLLREGRVARLKPYPTSSS
jgi:hypothetical protein